MRVYRTEGGSPKKAGRRWLKILIWTLVVLVVAAAAAAGAAYFYAKDVVNELGSARNPVEQKAIDVTSDAVITSKTPLIFLVLGIDKRPDDPNPRSDTLFLMRMDPVKKTVTMLSFPRDALVEVPGHGPTKITEAYHYGGPKLTIQTVKNLTGLVPNYYVLVDFSGFIDTVDALGGVFIDVDRRYFQGDDHFDLIDLQPGYQGLRGFRALQYVRHRHSDDDTYRNARQQGFMREFKKKLDPVDIGASILDLINVAKRNVRILGKHKPSIDNLYDWMNIIRSIPRSGIQAIEVPSNVSANSVTITQEAVDKAVADFVNPDPTLAKRAAQQAAGKGTGSAAPDAFDATTVPVEIRNGNGRTGSASDAEAQLIKVGWKAASQNGDADNADYFKTQIYYGTKKGSKEAATALGLLVEPSEVKPLAPGVVAALNRTAWPVAADVVMIVGQTFDKVARPSTKPLPPKERAAVAPAPPEDLVRYRQNQKKSRLKLWYPTLLPAGARVRDPNFSSLDPFRSYRLADGKRAVHVTYTASNKFTQVFGFQAIAWNNPPILDSPTAKKAVKGGLTYLLYFNGARLHRIAWQVGGNSYWLSNSIVDGLSNATIWKVATSFKPVSK